MKNNQPLLPREKVQYVISLYSNGQFHEAVDKIKALNESYPKEPLLFNLIGACYKELGQLEGAAKMFEVAVSIKPKYAEAHYNLGVIHQALGRLDAAVINYSKAIVITPNYPDAHNNLGIVYLDINQLDQAIKHFKFAISFVYSKSIPRLAFCLSSSL